ncbi:MAG: hypothetical protein EH225_01410 [Calditrichaeota bacterium]|nr:hypothetical protein [Calditrichota bacterium]RQW07637.1 MAG: hypothetical protein EH225_01410 [Calditrichota bacterium]
MTDIPSSKRAQLRDHWLAPDKAKHLMGSLISTVFFHQVASHGFQSSQSEAALAAAGISFALGAGKECMDRRKEGNFFSWKDLVADVAGLLTGLVIANQP